MLIRSEWKIINHNSLLRILWDFVPGKQQFLLEKQRLGSADLAESGVHWVFVLHRAFFRDAKIHPAHSTDFAIVCSRGELRIMTYRAFRQPSQIVHWNCFSIDHARSFHCYSNVTARMYSPRSCFQSCKIPFMAKTVLLPHFSQKRAFGALI